MAVYLVLELVHKIIGERFDIFDTFRYISVMVNVLEKIILGMIEMLYMYSSVYPIEALYKMLIYVM